MIPARRFHDSLLTRRPDYALRDRLIFLRQPFWVRVRRWLRKSTFGIL